MKLFVMIFGLVLWAKYGNGVSAPKSQVGPLMTGNRAVRVYPETTTTTKPPPEDNAGGAGGAGGAAGAGGAGGAGSAAECLDYHRNHSLYTQENVTYCDWAHDGYLCWPPTLAGEAAEQQCPETYLSDRDQIAFRRCNDEGKWIGRDGDTGNPTGWTNFTPCFPALVQDLLNSINQQDAQAKYNVASVTRQIEMYGFGLSFILLTISLGIFMCYECLNNERLKIHKNLFSALNAQVVVRLIIYMDQAVVREDSPLNSYSAIEDVPELCKLMYVILEYFINCCFIWMLIEGISLNRIVTTEVMRGTSSNVKFIIFGWVVPLVNTVTWAMVVAFTFAKDVHSQRCWYGYNFDPYFWIMQGPRVTVILVNLGFLLNIMRVLVLKIREDPASDVEKARKAVKAAFLLLPLLGITNILSMIQGPVSGPTWHFATWSYITHFLRSFQGAIIALLYCFRNEEVREVLARTVSTRIAIFRHRHPRLARAFFVQNRRPVRRFPRLRPFNPPRGRRPGDGDDDFGGPDDFPMFSLREWRAQPLTIPPPPPTIPAPPPTIPAPPLTIPPPPSPPAIPPPPSPPAIPPPPVEDYRHPSPIETDPEPEESASRHRVRFIIPPPPRTNAPRGRPYPATPRRIDLQRKRNP